MASFRTHISLGVALGILGCIGALSLTLASGPGFAVMLFVAATLGSILPDMDSDSSIPFHVTFGALSIVAATLVGFSVHQNMPGDWLALAVWTLGTVLFVWIVLGKIFKRFTRHRGMAHSIPAALLAGLVLFFLASRLGFSDSESFLLGVAINAGYLSHLILDEIFAALNFHGKLFIPNKALGSALKFKSDHTLANLLVFGALVLLAAGNTSRLWHLALSFWQSIS